MTCRGQGTLPLTRHGHPHYDQASSEVGVDVLERMVDWRLHALGRGTVCSPSRPCSSAIHLRSTVLMGQGRDQWYGMVGQPCQYHDLTFTHEYGVLSLSPSEREPTVA